MKFNQLLSIALICCSIILASCGNNTGTSADNKKTDTNAHRIQAFFGGGPAYTNVFIPADSANKMISSYLQSIDSGGTTDSSLHSLIFNADSLRAYLSNPEIKNVKVMFAHTLEYINTFGPGHHVGYESGALTVVFGGYDQNGNYVFWKANQVPDHSNGCPINCPSVGTASGDLFPTNH